MDVNWVNGMLLRPQHFQLQSLHLTRALHGRLSVIAGEVFGVIRLRWDDQLAMGVARLDAFEGVMPDGTVVQLDDCAPVEPLELPRTPGREVEIYLDIAKPTSTGSDIGDPDTGIWARFGAHRVQVSDTHGSAQRVELEVVRLSPRLRLGSTAPDGVETLLVGRIRCEDGPTWVHDPTFAPQTPCISSSGVFDQLIEPLIAEGHQARLAVARTLQALGLPHRDLVIGQGFIQVLSQMIARWSHVRSLDWASPEMAYAVFHEAVGGLTGVLLTAGDSGAATRELPRFDRRDPAGSIQAVADAIRELMRAVPRPEPYMELDVQRDEDIRGVMVRVALPGALSRGASGASGQIIVAVSGLERWPDERRAIRMGEPSALTKAVQRREDRLRWDHLQGDVLGLGPQWQYFAPEMMGRYWNDARVAQELGVHVSGDARDRPNTQVRAMMVSGGAR